MYVHQFVHIKKQLLLINFFFLLCYSLSNHYLRLYIFRFELTIIHKKSHKSHYTYSPNEQYGLSTTSEHKFKL